ncbi:neurotrimin-like, partial [Aphis craccivora]
TQIPYPSNRVHESDSNPISYHYGLSVKISVDVIPCINTLQSGKNNNVHRKLPVTSPSQYIVIRHNNTNPDVRQSAVPPDILDYPTSTDMVVREGGNVSMQCAASGFPSPSITWRREGGHSISLSPDT